MAPVFNTMQRDDLLIALGIYAAIAAWQRRRILRVKRARTTEPNTDQTAPDRTPIGIVGESLIWLRPRERSEGGCVRCANDGARVRGPVVIPGRRVVGRVGAVVRGRRRRGRPRGSTWAKVTTPGSNAANALTMVVGGSPARRCGRDSDIDMTSNVRNDAGGFDGARPCLGGRERPTNRRDRRSGRCHPARRS
jgi:hypothetical protein